MALEGAVPLLSAAAVAVGAGFAGAAMFASEAQQHPMVAPGAAYYLLTAGGIVVFLGIIAATFPLLAASPGPKSPETTDQQAAPAACTRVRADTVGNEEDLVRRVSPILLAVMAAGMTLASCSWPTGPSGPTGTLTGTFQAEGGPPGTGPRALAGQITLHESNGTRFSIAVSANGGFSVTAAVGTYTVTGGFPQYEGRHCRLCQASGPVTVTEGWP